MSLVEFIREDAYKEFLETSKDITGDVATGILRDLFETTADDTEHDITRYVERLLVPAGVTISATTMCALMRNRQVRIDEALCEWMLEFLEEPQTPDSLCMMLRDAMASCAYGIIPAIFKRVTRDCPLGRAEMEAMLIEYVVHDNASIDPRRHIDALLESWVDLAEYPEVLCAAIGTPGLGRELVRGGIPKRAAYESECMKEAWYREAVDEELGDVECPVESTAKIDRIRECTHRDAWTDFLVAIRDITPDQASYVVFLELAVGGTRCAHDTTRYMEKLLGLEGVTVSELTMCSLVSGPTTSSGPTSMRAFSAGTCACALAKLEDRTPETLRKVLEKAMAACNYDVLPIVYRAVAEECPYDDTALEFVLTCYMLHEDAEKNPERHIEVLTACGIDLEKFPRVHRLAQDLRCGDR